MRRACDSEQEERRVARAMTVRSIARRVRRPATCGIFLLVMFASLHTLGINQDELVRDDDHGAVIYQREATAKGIWLEIVRKVPEFFALDASERRCDDAVGGPSLVGRASEGGPPWE